MATAAAAVSAQHRRALRRARAASASGHLTMQERVDIAEALVRDASAGAAAGLGALRRVDEQRVTAFARGYMNVLKECLDEFLAGYKEAKHAEVRSWLASNPAAFQQLAGRVQAGGGELPFELLPPPPVPRQGAGATLRVGNSTLQLSEDTLRSSGSVLQRGADTVLQRGARLLEAAAGGGSGESDSVVSRGARALRDAASTVRGVDTDRAAAAAASTVAAATEQAAAAAASARREGALAAVQGAAGKLGGGDTVRAAQVEAAAVYAELRSALVGGQHAALSARADKAGAGAAAAARAAADRMQQGSGWFQSWLAPSEETPSNAGLIGLRGVEGLGQQADVQQAQSKTGDPVEWALGAVGSTNSAIRRAVRQRLAAEHAQPQHPVVPNSHGVGRNKDPR